LSVRLVIILNNS